MEKNLNTSNNEIAVIDENQINQFKSLYYLIKGKRDTDIKLFTDYKQFTYDDIIELNKKIYNKLMLHKLVTDIVNVTVGLDNKEIKSFGSWYEFTESDWNISACTKYITIEWDFNIILPNQTHEVPQTHTLRVRIGNSLRPSELIQVVFQGSEEHDFEEAQAQMCCKIDFINAQISNELKTIVTEWYDALKKNSEEFKLIKFISRNEMKVQNFIVLSFITSAIIFVNFLFPVYYYSDNDLIGNDLNHKLFLFSTTSIAVFYIFYQSGRLFARRVTRKQIDKLRRNPMFEFTKGDKNKFIEVAEDNKKYLYKLLGSIVLGLGVNGLSALIGYLLKFIF